MTTYDRPEGDAQAIIDYVRDAAVRSTLPEPVLAGLPTEVISYALPQGTTRHIEDLERFRAVPRDQRGQVQLHTAEALAGYVLHSGHHGDNAAALYGDTNRWAITAVLNGHGNDGDGDGPFTGWGDHRAVVTLQFTDAWKHWTGKDGAYLKQVDFAEHIESGSKEIVDPDPATMLELAQSIQATSSAEFKSGNRLKDGQRQLIYTETVAASAGTNGTIEIPEIFELGIIPFEGADAYRVLARLRYRINGGQLVLAYALDRPNDVLRDAFGHQLEKVAEESGLRPLLGVAPSPLR